MGNIFAKKVNIKLLKYLADFHIKNLGIDESTKIKTLTFESFEDNPNTSLIGNSISWEDLMSIPVNFILCKSQTIDDIVENTKQGYDSVCYIYCSKMPLCEFSVKDLWLKSSTKLSIIEIQSTEMSPLHKTLLRDPDLKCNYKTYRTDELINGILVNFVYYPIIKNLLLTLILDNYIINDIRLHILNLYIRLLYIF